METSSRLNCEPLNEHNETVWALEELEVSVRPAVAPWVQSLWSYGMLFIIQTWEWYRSPCLILHKRASKLITKRFNAKKAFQNPVLDVSELLGPTCVLKPTIWIQINSLSTFTKLTNVSWRRWMWNVWYCLIHPDICEGKHLRCPTKRHSIRRNHTTSSLTSISASAF